MQGFITIAASDDLMKYVFIGIFIFVALLGNILKIFGFKDSKEGERKPSSRGDSEDMQRAKRQLQEMIRERNAQNSNFPKAPKSIFDEDFEEEPSLKPVFEEEPKSIFDMQEEAPKPVFKEERRATKPFANFEPRQKPNISKQAPKQAQSENAYSQENFDYDAAFKATEKLLVESEIAFDKASAKASLKDAPLSEIKMGEIKDFVHNKDMLKKSIIISEILDKPLSLR